MIQSADAESTGGGPSSRSPPLVHDQDIDSEFGEETSGEGPGETDPMMRTSRIPLPHIIRFDGQGRASSPSSAAWASTLARIAGS